MSLDLGERWHLNHNIQTRRVNQASLSVLWHINCASQLSSLNPKQIQLAPVRRNQQIVLTWMQIKAGNLTLSNKVLHQLRFGHMPVSYVHQLHSDTIWCTD